MGAVVDAVAIVEQRRVGDRVTDDRSQFAGHTVRHTVPDQPAHDWSMRDGEERTAWISD